MKVFQSFIRAENKITGESQVFAWKPIVAISEEAAYANSPEYVFIGEEIDTTEKDFDKALIEFYRNVNI
jgi:hypothetical protein